MFVITVLLGLVVASTVADIVLSCSLRREYKRLQKKFKEWKEVRGEN